MKFIKRRFQDIVDSFDERKREERYLSQASSMIDLEARQRSWDRARNAAERSLLR